MLDQALIARLVTLFAKITKPVTLVASLDESEKSVELAGLLDEIGALSSESVLSTGRTVSKRMCRCLVRTALMSSKPSI
jgi:NADH-dependent peroxiredoxin subunit F